MLKHSLFKQNPQTSAYSKILSGNTSNLTSYSLSCKGPRMQSCLGILRQQSQPLEVADKEIIE